MGNWDLNSIKKTLADQGTCYVLFRRKVYNKEQVQDILRAAGWEGAEAEEGAVFWRLRLRPVPSDGTPVLIPLGSDIFALGVEESADPHI